MRIFCDLKYASTKFNGVLIDIMYSIFAHSDKNVDRLHIVYSISYPFLRDNGQFYNGKILSVYFKDNYVTVLSRNKIAISVLLVCYQFRPTANLVFS